jgi:hypothetical protein
LNRQIFLQKKANNIEVAEYFLWNSHTLNQNRTSLDKLYSKYNLSKREKKADLIKQLLVERKKLLTSFKASSVMIQLETLRKQKKRKFSVHSDKVKDISALKRKKKLSAYDMKEKDSSIHGNKDSKDSISENITVDSISKKKVRKGSVDNIDDSDIILTLIDAIKIEDLVISISNCSSENKWWNNNIINAFMHILHIQYGDIYAFFDCFLIQGRSAKISVNQFLDARH